ncbi:Hok/Gef family protein [Providencia rettgeri]|uniref:Hok/Gef family protein n=1 Tax=Providencia rettgeri TaxID=587 RepID=A0A939NBR2_PRORE|nr:Hok/Gef family protein [Providencia rettgeri]
MGLVTVCLTVLCFSLLMQERLCSFSISSGNSWFSYVILRY